MSLRVGSLHRSWALALAVASGVGGWLVPDGRGLPWYGSSLLGCGERVLRIPPPQTTGRAHCKGSPRCARRSAALTTARDRSPRGKEDPAMGIVTNLTIFTEARELIRQTGRLRVAIDREQVLGDCWMEVGLRADHPTVVGSEVPGLRRLACRMPGRLRSHRPGLGPPLEDQLRLLLRRRTRHGPPGPAPE